jgi:hypothetical protein
MTNNMKSLLLVGFVSALVAGCSGTVDGGGTSSTGTTSSSGAGGNGTGGHATGGHGTGGHGTGGTAGAGGSGIACGGFAGLTCADTEYCDYPDDICGAADGQGVCRARPQVCPDNYSPTCACNGMVYGNNCEAAGAGFDVSDISSCMPPMANQFNCGHGFCDSVTEYCAKTYSDVGGTPDSYVCAPLPAACAGMQPSCACIGNPCGAPIPGECVATGIGFKVSCPGG